MRARGWRHCACHRGRSQELRALLSSELGQSGIPLLVVLNKCDLRGSSATSDALRAMSVTLGEDSVMRCSVADGTGLPQLAAWLGAHV